jgi:hypothetical protein
MHKRFLQDPARKMSCEGFVAVVFRRWYLQSKERARGRCSDFGPAHFLSKTFNAKAKNEKPSAPE